MSTGLLGGTFDPPHNGHLGLARAALKELALERLVVTVTGRPPYKQVETDAETRFRLAGAAFGDEPAVDVSRAELDRPGPTYTVDTVRELEDRFGDLVVVVGADMFAGFLSWREPDRILEHAHLAVAARAGTERDQLRSVLGRLEQPERVSFFDMPRIDVSSSDVRRRVAAGEPYEDLVPPAVARLIDELQLYRGGRERRYNEANRERI